VHISWPYVIIMWLQWSYSPREVLLSKMWLIVGTYIGKVMVDGKLATKVCTFVKSSSIIDIITIVPKYVCMWLSSSLSIEDGIIAPLKQSITCLIKFLKLITCKLILCWTLDETRLIKATCFKKWWMAPK